MLLLCNILQKTLPSRHFSLLSCVWFTRLTIAGRCHSHRSTEPPRAPSKRSFFSSSSQSSSGTITKPRPSTLLSKCLIHKSDCLSMTFASKHQARPTMRSTQVFPPGSAVHLPRLPSLTSSLVQTVPRRLLPCTNPVQAFGSQASRLLLDDTRIDAPNQHALHANASSRA